ncbi:MAG: hypothetical protein KF865_10880 [Bdellovibrionaceae bacterium]|nr:hypothetical protein [Pseudobdellovibrionaceae bacterium]
MDFRDNKLELGIGLLVAVMVLGLFQLFGSVKDSPVNEVQDISYEMGRPKSEMIGEFGLGGREIDRRYVNPYAKKAAQAAADAKNVKPAATNPAAAQAAAAKAKQAAAAAARARQQQQRPMVWVKRPNSNAPTGRDGRHLSGDGSDGGPIYSNPNEVAGNRNKEDTGVDNKNDNKDQLSPDQWRALLAAQPTKENMNKLVEALGRREVDETTFYSIIDGLMKSQKKEDQTLALYGLGRVGTAKSFAYIATAADTLPADMQPAAQQLMMSYAAPARHGALKQALQMNDPVVALKAAQVVLAGAQAAKNGDSVVSDPRQGRGDIRQSNTTSFASFAPIFQKWATSGDATMQGIANQILGLLPTAQA